MIFIAPSISTANSEIRRSIVGKSSPNWAAVNCAQMEPVFLTWILFAGRYACGLKIITILGLSGSARIP